MCFNVFLYDLFFCLKAFVTFSRVVGVQARTGKDMFSKLIGLEVLHKICNHFYSFGLEVFYKIHQNNMIIKFGFTNNCTITDDRKTIVIDFDTKDCFFIDILPGLAGLVD